MAQAAIEPAVLARSGRAPSVGFGVTTALADPARLWIFLVAVGLQVVRDLFVEPMTALPAPSNLQLRFQPLWKRRRFTRGLVRAHFGEYFALTGW